MAKEKPPRLRINREGQEVQIDFLDCAYDGILITAAGARRAANILNDLAAEIDAIESDIQCHTVGGRNNGE